MNARAKQLERLSKFTDISILKQVSGHLATDWFVVVLLPASHRPGRVSVPFILYTSCLLHCSIIPHSRTASD